MTDAHHAVPHHIAVILDGNNRWQKSSLYRKSTYASGHEAGAGAVERLIDGALKQGVSYLTLFAFSTENWQRDTKEITHLLDIFHRVATDKKVTQHFMKRAIRFHTIGDIDAFAHYRPSLPDDLRNLCARTQNNSHLVVTAALNYGGRWDIVTAALALAQDIADKKLHAHSVDEARFARYLSTAEPALPDPDLLIRTSNELRISNFLLWQCAYSELHFTDTLWPDFTEQDLDIAIKDYQTRKRNFGARI